MNSFIDRLIDVVLNPKNLLIVVLCIIIFFMYTCNGCGKENAIQGTQKTKISYFKVYDSVPRTITITKWIVKDHEVKIPTYITDTLDCWEWITQLYTENQYDSILRDDSTAYIRFKGIVWNNQLGQTELTFKNRLPIKVNVVQTTTTEVVTAKNKVFVGGNIGFNTSFDKIGVMVDVGLQTKKDKYFQVAYDIPNKTCLFGIKWKIKFK